jgi:hypothetical protein
VAERFWMMVSRGVVWAKETAAMTKENAADLRRIFFIGDSGILASICLKLKFTFSLASITAKD